MTSNVGIKKLQEFGTGVGFSTKSLEKNKSSAAEEILKKGIKKTIPTRIFK